MRLIAGAFLAPSVALGAYVTPVSPINSIGDFQSGLCDILGWVYTFCIIAGVIYAIFCAYKYLTSGGDPNKVSEATKGLTYTAVGLAVAMVSVGIPGIVGGLLNSGFGLSFSSFCSGE
jgi:hypothetical protein